jgi:hypothetical protein
VSGLIVYSLDRIADMPRLLTVGRLIAGAGIGIISNA